MNNLTAFLPCRKGSERIKNKSTRTFAGISGGLTHIKILQLIQARKIDKIVISTNDEEVIGIAKNINSDKVIIDKRPDNLAMPETSTDDLIAYAGDIIKTGDIL